MVYDHIVKFGGKYYEAGENVPDDVNTKTKEENHVAFEGAETPSPSTEKKAYTKSEISTMSTADLQDLADKEGIPDAKETSGSKLKKILVEHFGL